MKFTLDAGGAQAAGQGIGSLFKAFALGPQMRQQAEMEAMGSMAKIGQAQAVARKYNADADLDAHKLKLQQDPLQTAMLEHGLPTSLAPAFKQRLETGNFGGGYDTPAVDGVGPVMPAPADNDTVARLGRSMALMQKVYGTGSNVAMAADAELKNQQMRQIDDAIRNPELVDRIGAAQAAGSGKVYDLYNSVGSTGGTLNKRTGDAGPVDSRIAKIFEIVQMANANQSNASAGASGASASLSNARRERVVGGYDKTTDMVGDDGTTTITRLPTGGAPVSVGVAPSKGNGEAATNAKARNAVVAAVEKELGTTATDREIQTEVDRRLARRGGNKSPAPAPAAPKMQLPQGMTPDKAIASAKAAIAAGKDRAAVIKRLQDMGVEPKGL